MKKKHWTFEFAIEHEMSEKIVYFRGNVMSAVLKANNFLIESNCQPLIQLTDNIWLLQWMYQEDREEATIAELADELCGIVLKKSKNRMVSLKKAQIIIL